jgi:Uma2 family endonuclease
LSAFCPIEEFRMSFHDFPAMGLTGPRRRTMQAMSATAYPPGRPWVAEDLDDMPDDGLRREVIDGVLLVTAAPFIRHQVFALNLARVLADACPDEMQVLVAPTDWRPGNRDCFEPDLMVARLQDFDPDDHLRKTPLLVVEILSRSTSRQDRLVKRDAYQALSVPAYWIIDTHEPGITALRIDERGTYIEEAHVVGDHVFRATFPYPVEVVPAHLPGQLRRA